MGRNRKGMGMHTVAFIFFTAAFMLALTVVAGTLFASRQRIVDALLGCRAQPEPGPSAEILYLTPRSAVDVEWRKAA